uniref:Uncharacterized protein n=1 Tax=Solanum lycopersicum TaxID=4081 RepID=A0A3Q7IMS3_SOLLC
MTFLNLFAFKCVVTIVIITPRCDSNRAISIIGIVWPCAMKGNNTKCGSIVRTPIVKSKEKNERIFFFVVILLHYGFINILFNL